MSAKIPKPMIGVLGLLAMTSPLISDMYLPVFTDIERDLGVSASSVQLTLTGFLLGLGLGQLFLGPLSDALGRKTVLIAGLIIFSASSFIMIFSPNIQFFIILRVIQGVSGAAGVVLARAIAADVTSGSETVKLLSIIAIMIGLGPIIAPPIGGFTNIFFNWRGVLTVVAFITLAMLLLTLKFVPETLAKENRQPAKFTTTRNNFKQLMRNQKFLLPMIAFASCYGSLSAYIAASPFVGQLILSMTPFTYSLAFAVSSVALIAANFINAQVAGKIEPHSMLLVGGSLSLVASLFMLFAVLLGFLNIPIFMTAAFFMTAGTGFILSNASAIGLNAASKFRGSASALLGAGQFFFGALVSPLVGVGGSDTALPMGIVMALSSAFAFAAAFSAFIANRRGSGLNAETPSIL